MNIEPGVRGNLWPPGAAATPINIVTLRANEFDSFLAHS